MGDYATAIACGTSLSSNRCSLMTFGNRSATMAPDLRPRAGDEVVQREYHHRAWARAIRLKRRRTTMRPRMSRPRRWARCRRHGLGRAT